MAIIHERGCPANFVMLLCISLHFITGFTGHTGFTGATGATGARGRPGPACIYNAELDFYPVMKRKMPYENPVKEWEIGYASTAPLEEGGPNFIPFNMSFIDPMNPDVHCLGAGSNSFCQNVGIFPSNGMGPRQIALHPSQGMYQYSILRFTAPQSGFFEISSIFFAGEDGRVDVLIYQDDRLLKILGDTPASYTFTALMSMGGYVDFVVGPSNDTSTDDFTPLDVTIRNLQCVGDTG